LLSGADQAGAGVNLIDALEIWKRPVANGASRRRTFLACGFTPLHLKTLLQAELQLRSPETRIEIGTGLFGDLIGNLERLDPAGLEECFAVVEWADLDPRLGIRSLGGWQPSVLPDIVDSAERSAERLLAALGRAGAAVATVVSLPTLPLPPLFFTRPHSASAFELRLHQSVANLATGLSERRGIRILSSQILNEASPAERRLDVKSDVVTGFPYTLEHASAVAELLARLAESRPTKKGLITDLDDTLWSGILGEDGVNGVSWSLENGTHVHGLYQQFLASLAGAGVLIGVASKNDAALVNAAFERTDLRISRKDIFPVEANWSQKSESVKRILETWNVAADSVVFVDDSPMESAEVKAAFPEMECIVFPKSDYQRVWELLRYLRDLFGKQFLTGDDALRLDSIRKSGAWRESIVTRTASADDFLRAAGASITFNVSRDAGDARAFELVNKTNQFNLNGKRFSDSEWLEFFKDPGVFLLTVNYEDKYGALGKIGVLLGAKAARDVRVTAWVMSCRAFSRRIEHQCLNYLFEELGANELTFEYQATPRNGPLQEFFRTLLNVEPADGMRVSRDLFARNAPPLFHQVKKAAVHV
jgi:FkbH-like protein